MIDLKDFLKDTFAIITGSIIFASGLCIFAYPSDILTGGAGGIAMLIKAITGIPLGTGILIVNIPLIIASFFICGKKYTLRTLYCVVLFSLITDLFETLVPYRYSSNTLVCAIYGGILTGLGLYTVMARGIVTGGSDLLAYMIQLSQPHRSIGTLVLIIDGVIILLGALYYGSVETALYSMTLIIIMTLVLDNRLQGRTQGNLHFIFTQNPDAVKNQITNVLDRGFSVVSVTGGYTGQSREMILCAVSLRESPILRRLVFEADADAFIIIGDVESVYGNGFIGGNNA